MKLFSLLLTVVILTGCATQTEVHTHDADEHAPPITENPPRRGGI